MAPQVCSTCPIPNITLLTTLVPGDAGKQNVIPSVAGPHQKGPAGGGLGASDLQTAADNAATGSHGVGEGVTGTGDSLPDSTTGKSFGKNSHGGKEAGSHSSNRPGAVLSSKVNRADRDSTD
ncbi:hypothetical protein HJFPF1_02514 [Paramyrothecium foliicola]|nr:hypothetical protein HJFPF1_02514 [Paramyrothecium foliicola]